MKFRTKGFIKTFCYRDLFIPGFTIKVKVYGPSLRSADYRRPMPGSGGLNRSNLVQFSDQFASQTLDATKMSLVQVTVMFLG